MANFSGSKYSLCNEGYPTVLCRPAENFGINLATCILIGVSAPIAAASNGLIFASIWKNSSLRTPSYVLLSALAVNDFFTGLLTQPAFLLGKILQLNQNNEASSILYAISLGLGGYIFVSSLAIIAWSAVERWFYMKRRPLLTVRRIIIVYTAFNLLLLANLCRNVYAWFVQPQYFSSHIFLTLSCFSISMVMAHVFVMLFSYFKVFQIVQQHQREVHNNATNIDMLKYRKSISNRRFATNL